MVRWLTHMYRRKLKHSRVKNLHKFASQKNKSTCLVESSLEFDACFHFEFSPSIAAFEAQPLGYEYEFDNRICRYTPDFLLTHTDGTQKFIEVKPQSKIADEDFRARFIEKQTIAKQDGRDLILVTDKQIRVYPTLNNLKLLHRYSGFQSLTELQASVLELVKQYGSIKVGQLVSFLKVTAGELLATVLRLLSLGQLFADLTTNEISIETAIWSNNV